MKVELFSREQPDFVGEAQMQDVGTNFRLSTTECLNKVWDNNVTAVDELSYQQLIQQR